MKNLRKVRLGEFAAWAERQDPRRVLGRAGEADGCPVRTYLQNITKAPNIVTYTAYSEVRGEVWHHDRGLRLLIIELDLYTPVDLSAGLRKEYVMKAVTNVRNRMKHDARRAAA